MLESLPNRPLDTTILAALESTGKVTMSQPLLGLANDPVENVIAAFLITDSAGHIVVHESQSGWVRLDIEADELAEGELSEVRERLLDWADWRLDNDPPVILSRRLEPEARYVEMLPKRPLVAEDLRSIRCLQGLEKTYPLFGVAGGQDIVAVGWLDLPVDTDGVESVQAAGYDPQTATWIEIATVQNPADPIEAVEGVEVTVQEWLEDRYPPASLTTV